MNDQEAHPRPETTPGVFLEHFDMSWPTHGEVVYIGVLNSARQAAEHAGWGFRSYSAAESGGTHEDFINRNIRSFPTLILYCDGVELDRLTWVSQTVRGILSWAGQLLKDKNIVPHEEWIEQINIPTPPPPITLKNEADLEAMLLRKEVERHMSSGTAMEVIYFGGSLPGLRRKITPRCYGDPRHQNRIVALCHLSEEEKTFRLDRMHLPCSPLEDGQNDYRAIVPLLNHPTLLDGMLDQIADLGNLPIEKALSAQRKAGESYESFFEEFPYGGYALELQLTSAMIRLSFGFEANDVELIHYHFSPEAVPRLMAEIATHYDIYKRQ